MVPVLLALLVGAIPDTVVVCPDPFRDALQPWVEYRQAQGHQLLVVSTDRSAHRIRASIRSAALGGGLRSVVLVGDVAPAGRTEPDVHPRCVPTHWARARINVRWGSEPEIATDNWYADLDDDQVPDLAIGRLTADTPDELSRIVRKILSYERSMSMGAWRRRVDFVAGTGGFGALTDSLIEMVAKRLITGGVPDAYATSMTYASWRSPYCPDPRDFHQITLRRLNEGSLVWVYLGHGQRNALDRLRTPAGTFHILGTDDVARVRCTGGLPIAVLLSCYSGAFDAPVDCLAEQMLRNEQAPVAIICGTRVTMPYAMAVLGMGLLDELFQHQRTTVGDILLHAKRGMVAEDQVEPNRLMLDAMAAAVSPSPEDPAGERREHLLLFNLIGDPLLRVRRPRQVLVKAPARAGPGDMIEISGTSPVDGKTTVELVARRDRLTFEPPARRRFDLTEDALEEMNRVYRHANDGRWSSRTVNTEGGTFRTALEIPSQAHGSCRVRVYVEGADDFAAGSSRIYLRRPHREAKKETGRQGQQGQPQG